MAQQYNGKDSEMDVTHFGMQKGRQNKFESNRLTLRELRRFCLQVAACAGLINQPSLHKYGACELFFFVISTRQAGFVCFEWEPWILFGPFRP